VVDGAGDRSAEPVTREFQESDTPLAVRYLAGPAGLTRQRNRGIDAASAEVVAFADDDVEFEPGAFAALAAAYADATVVGATGRILEEEPRRVGGARSRLRRLLPGGGDDGTMTRFGYPRRLTDHERARDVEFMHGCLMSARLDVARQVRFDEALTGYGLAEDEDFGYRVSRVGRVRYVPGARVRHLASGFRTSDRRRFDRMLVVNRAYLFRKNLPQTPRARAQFALMVPALMAHRALNGEWAGVRGLLEGAAEAWRTRSVRPLGPSAADAERLAQGPAGGRARPI
jgi:GT2 family glycosyltransferase